ncbi:MAG: hypothetical protein ACOVO1_03635 [Chitinophagaceae bacterium]
MKHFFSLLFLLFSFSLFSQTKPENFAFFQNLNGERKVFADTAIIRIAPSSGAAVNDTLFLGDDINVLMQVPYSEVKNNVAFPWLKITYKKGVFVKVGFISAIDIAINDKASMKENEFVWGISSAIRKDTLMNNETVFVNHYLGKVKVKTNKNKWINASLEIPSAMMVDTVVSSVFKRIKLSSSKGVIQIDVTSTKNKALVYQYNFIYCNKNKLAQLETINSIQKTQMGLKPITSFYKYFSNKIVFVMSGFMDGDKEIESYKLSDCSIIKI